ncbi:MAG TPA: hypothetical protein VF410_10285, partial [Rhizomicrobium sp.]
MAAFLMLLAPSLDLASHDSALFQFGKIKSLDAEVALREHPPILIGDISCAFPHSLLAFFFLLHPPSPSRRFRRI